MSIKNKHIREYLGHNGAERKVKITQNGEVHTYGSTNYFDRSKDFWMFEGFKSDIIEKIKQDLNLDELKNLQINK